MHLGWNKEDKALGSSTELPFWIHPNYLATKKALEVKNVGDKNTEDQGMVSKDLRKRSWLTKCWVKNAVVGWVPAQLSFMVGDLIAEADSLS